MRVRMIHQREIQGAGPLGPTVRVLEVGDVVDLPEIHAHMFVAQGDAKIAGEDDEKPKARRPRAAS